MLEPRTFVKALIWNRTLTQSGKPIFEGAILFFTASLLHSRSKEKKCSLASSVNFMVETFVYIYDVFACWQRQLA